MTKDHKILSLQLPAQELADLDTEAQAPPFLGNRSDYCRSILEGRHQQTIIASPEAQRLIDYHSQRLEEEKQNYQQQLDALRQEGQSQREQLAQCQQQITQLEQQISSTARQHQLEGEKAQRAYQKLDVQKQTHEFTAQLEKERYQTTSQELTDCQQQGRRSNDQVKQLKQALQQAKSFEARALALSKGAGEMMARNPVIGQTIEKNGLLGLFAIPRKAAPTPPPPSPPSIQTRVGESIYRDFAGARLPQILIILPFLRDNPAEQNKLVATPSFQAYQQQFKERTAKNKPDGKG